MFEPHEYELLDFGAGRKLERFGSEVLDRPSPAAASIDRSDPELWGSASARFEVARGGAGQWSQVDPSMPQPSDSTWSVRHGGSRLLLKQSASGNVGLFPEQASNWGWIADRVSGSKADSRRPRVLNLFAYTGAASLAAAAAGAEVTHVDSSGPTVAWAKKNADASAMGDLPIRWLVEDAIKFAAREVRRGNVYDGIIADPPTYGHGPKGRAFKFDQHVGELLQLCGELLNHEDHPDRFLLFSCHAPGFGPDDAVSLLADVLPDSAGSGVTGRPLSLQSADGRELSAGVSARWSS